MEFSFFGFLEVFFGFWSKVAKSSRKQKNTQKNNTHDRLPLGPARSVEFVLFLVFLRYFLFLTTSSKYLEKAKKQDCAPHFSTATPHSICFFFGCFLGLSTFLLLFGSKPKNLEITKKQKTRGEQWQRVGSCHFVFCFCVSLISFFGKSTAVDHWEEGLLRRILFL